MEGTGRGWENCCREATFPAQQQNQNPMPLLTTQQGMKRKQRRNTIARPITGFPHYYSNDPFLPEMRRRLTYSTIAGLSSAATGNVGTTKVLGLNCLYDPDISGAGHQPFGFDQLCSANGPYLRYKVNSVHIKVTCITQGSADAWAVFAVHNAASAATVSGLSLDILPEKQNVHYGFVSTAGSQERVFHFNFDSRSFPDLYGWSKLQAQSDVDGSTGGYNANPGTIPRFEYGIATAKVAISSIQTIVEVIYDTTFYGRAQLTPS